MKLLWSAKSTAWTGGNVPNCARNVYEGIGPVEKCQAVLVAVHEPLLDVMFIEWKQKGKDRLVLKPQNPQAIILRHAPQLVLLKDSLADNLGHAVEQVGDDPVEHFHQEGKLLQDTAVNVIGKS